MSDATSSVPFPTPATPETSYVAASGATVRLRLIEVGHYEVRVSSQPLYRATLRDAGDSLYELTPAPELGMPSGYAEEWELIRYF